MKKLLLLLIITGLFSCVTAQNTFKYPVHANGGIRVGGATNYLIDKIIELNGNFAVFNSGDTAMLHIPHEFREELGEVVNVYSVKSYGALGDGDTDDDKTTDGTGSDSFTSKITGLTASTTYYVRAYATNEAGTSYGSNVMFETPIKDVMKFYFRNGKIVMKGGKIYVK